MLSPEVLKILGKGYEARLFAAQAKGVLIFRELTGEKAQAKGVLIFRELTGEKFNPSLLTSILF